MAFIRPACSRLTSILKRVSLNFLHLNKPEVVQGSLGVQIRVREIYTHNRDTGIKIFEQNVKQLKSSGHWLPSYIHHSPDISQEEMEDLYGAFPEIVEDFTRWPATEKFPRGNQRTRELLEYAVAWSPVAAAQTMMADRFYARQRRIENRIVSEQDEKQRCKRAHQLAWCLELIIRPIYVNDDIMDGHTKRNGLPTWNSLPHIGLGAVNDSALLTQGGYCLLHKYFGDQDYYHHLLTSVYDGLLVTQVGENDLKLINMFSEEGTTLESLTCVKSMLNATIFPNLCIIAAMIINGIRDLELEKQVTKIGIDAIVYGTMVEDYADCFGGELVTQRQTNDISTGKQTWVLFKALELASPEQRQRLKMNYGKEDAVSVQTVLAIFKELNLREIFLKTAEETYQMVLYKINQLPQNEFPVNVVLGVFNHYRAVAKGVVARI